MDWCHHYIIDWDKVESLDDLKKIIKLINPTFKRSQDISEINHLVKLVEKSKDFKVTYD